MITYNNNTYTVNWDCVILSTSILDNIANKRNIIYTAASLKHP